MFAKLSILAVVVTAVAAAAHLAVFGRRRPPAGEGHADENPEVVRRYSWFERTVHLVLAVGFVDLAVTGFGGAVLFGGMGGWLLWWHFAGAGVFVVALTLAVLRWSYPNRFGPHDWEWAKAAGGYLHRPATPPPAGRFDAGQKAFFWLSSTTALVCVGAILLGMFPLFGTDGQSALVRVHRYTALALLVMVLVHAYASLAKAGGAGGGPRHDGFAVGPILPPALDPPGFAQGVSP